jgi:hypothetical protein
MNDPIKELNILINSATEDAISTAAAKVVLYNEQYNSGTISKTEYVDLMNSARNSDELVELSDEIADKALLSSCVFILIKAASVVL